MTAGIVTTRFTTKWPMNPSSLVIARLGGSRDWSHSMNIINGVAYEATMTHGCRAVPVGEAMKGVKAYRDMYVPVPDIEAARQFGRDQVNKGYDFAGAFGLPWLASTDWEDWRRWWCSELNFMQLAAGGVWLLDPSEQSRVTPNDLHQCNFPKSEVVRLRR